jgi:hypothetical protein
MFCQILALPEKLNSEAHMLLGMLEELPEIETANPSVTHGFAL